MYSIPYLLRVLPMYVIDIILTYIIIYTLNKPIFNSTYLVFVLCTFLSHHIWSLTCS